MLAAFVKLVHFDAASSRAAQEPSSTHSRLLQVQLCRFVHIGHCARIQYTCYVLLRKHRYCKNEMAPAYTTCK